MVSLSRAGNGSMGHGSMGQMGRFSVGWPMTQVGIFTYTVKLASRYQKSKNANETREYEQIPVLDVASFYPLSVGWAAGTIHVPYYLILHAEYWPGVLAIPASSAECKRHFSAFNAKRIITGKRNMLFPETVQAITIVLDAYKNKRLT